MKVSLKQIGKRFNKEWIFRNLTLDLHTGASYALTGPNGSGKSTLLKIVSGYMPPSTGRIDVFEGSARYDFDEFYKKLIYIAPYTELIEEFTLNEFLHFHFRFKAITQGYNINKIIADMRLERASHKPISEFSSGMKQRVKLALAFFSACDILLLDEPSTNLDQEGFEWYLDNVKKSTKNKIILIASNQKSEYEWAEYNINLMEYKRP